MALTQCKECQQVVSTQAASCPHCGARGPFVPPLPPPAAQVKAAKWKDGMQTAMILLATFGFLGLFIAWKAGAFDSPPAPEPPKVETQADKDTDAGMGAVIAARDAVKMALKDPESAKFSAQFAVKSPTGDIIACGKVNAKNGYGGYEGVSAYVTNGDKVLIETSTNANAVRTRWNATCAKYPTVYAKPQL